MNIRSKNYFFHLDIIGEVYDHANTVGNNVEDTQEDDNDNDNLIRSHLNNRPIIGEYRRRKVEN